METEGNNVRSLYSTTMELEKELRSLLKSNPHDKNIPILRNSIRESYKSIILSDFEFSISKEIEQSLWKTGFYKSIEEFRRAIRKFATAAANGKKDAGHSVRSQLRNKCGEFRTFLARSIEFYQDLIDKLRDKYDLSLDGTVVYDATLVGKDDVSDGLITRSGNRAYVSCNRCNIFLGDLTRYHRDLYGEPEAAQKDWSKAENYYKKALTVMPDNGNPHNQLAVVATYRDDDLEAVYRYFRSLAVKVPFATANDNLRVLFEKNRTKLLALNDPQQSQSSQTRISRKEKSVAPDDVALFGIHFVRLHGILFTGNSVETYPDLKLTTMKQFQALLARDSLDSSRLFKILLINIFSFHRTIREGEQSVLHQLAYLLLFEVAGRVANRVPTEAPLLPSPHLAHLSIFLDWALHHHALLHPSSPQQEDAHRLLGKSLAPALTAVIRSPADVTAVPTVLAEEADAAAFLPLSTTFPLVPPPVFATPHSQRLAKMKTAIATLLRIRPSWAPLVYDEQNRCLVVIAPAESLTPPVRSTPNRPSQALPPPQQLQGTPTKLPQEASPVKPEDMRKPDVSMKEIPDKEQAGSTDRPLDAPIDASPVKSAVEEKRRVSPPAPSSPIEFNDDDDEDMDEVILFNPFLRPNQNQPSTPIGGERSKTTGGSDEDSNIPTNDKAPKQEESTLYTPPHRQGVDIDLTPRVQLPEPGKEAPPKPSATRPPIRPPPGFAPLPASNPPAGATESLFSSFQPAAATGGSQQGDAFSSFFGLGSPIAPSHVAYPFAFRQSSPPPPATAGPWAAMNRTSPAPSPPRTPHAGPQQQYSPQPASPSAEQSDQTWASVPWPFAPHRAAHQQGRPEERGQTGGGLGWMSAWHTPLPPQQWNGWDGTPKTNNPFLTN